MNAKYFKFGELSLWLCDEQTYHQHWLFPAQRLFCDTLAWQECEQKGTVKKRTDEESSHLWECRLTRFMVMVFGYTNAKLEVFRVKCPLHTVQLQKGHFYYVSFSNLSKVPHISFSLILIKVLFVWSAVELFCYEYTLLFLHACCKR